ncbi:Phosphatidylinositol 4-phosphate 3-kinase C2 domain-containing subunit alpha [Liparis tanakae]|uniref:Phosphatidylinositol 4-phosphate 3-kinase C2 domain-containing subunit alpha n=1 Tax=Liparis tanakae TaxID=230148 RepID=A0A4Z2E9S5_9TELE|nr:Phosphatidylinositol 4-phosphate 3-kinase C2 domain-containing subunit alpha [Liparis tanakae]
MSIDVTCILNFTVLDIFAYISDRPHGVYFQTRGRRSDTLLFSCFSYEKYFLMCSLTHNGKNLFKPVQSKRVGTYKSFFYHIKWDEL